MARPLAKSPTTSAWSDVVALLMLGTGMLLYLALISYTPGDLPTWIPFSQYATPNSPAQNFIGRVGAVVAGLHFFFFGAASFLIAALLLGFGGAKLIIPDLRVARRLGWMILFVLSGACLAQLQPWFLHHLRGDFNAHGPGGYFGALLVGKPSDEGLFRRLLGAAGSAIFLFVIYLCTLIRMTGLHPVTQLRRALEASRALLARWQEQLAARRLANATAQERLEMDRTRLVKEQRRIEKQLRRRGVAVAPPVPDDDEEEPEDATHPGTRVPALASASADEFAGLPAPKITDNSIPSPVTVPPKKKPSLAEVFARNKAAKAGAAAAGAVSPALDEGGDVRFANYELPDLDLLDTADIQGRQAADPAELERVQNQIVDTLEQFGIRVSKGDITKGPTITRYEVYPAKGVRVDKIVSLERDIARATRAERINILAPIPGKDTVGIEIANSKKVKVTLRELLEGADWRDTQAKIPLALGKDVYGKTIIADLAAMPHCLVAGATGSGKSVCINSIISSILYRFTPEQMRFVMIDPKVVEMQVYNQLPHLVVPVVTDPKKVLLALRWVIDEMEKRYKIFAKTNVRNITTFNARPKLKTQAELDAEAEAAGLVTAGANAAAASGAQTTGFKLDSLLGADGDDELDAAPISTHARPAPRNIRDDDLIIPDHMPYIVVIVDELADLMQTAPADVESAIARITQMARAAGIHMIVATQTPRADVITGVIKANIPSRIAFQVASKLDSRVILDENGADRLLGQGDMMYLPPGTSRLVRAQGVLVTDEEIHRLVEFAGKQAAPTFEAAIADKLDGAADDEDEDVTDEDEELVAKCIEIMRQEKKASTSMLQRRLRLGYTRAARVVDILERRGIVGPENGARGREILVDLDSL
jgi:S-DNA-T family DNA segregation ATPase FtsK/SpoIIIE